MLTSIQFLIKHSYSVKDMTEKQAEEFIIKNGTDKISFNYMKKRAKYLLKKRNEKWKKKTHSQN